MSRPILEVLDPGLGLSFQDLGRCGWKRFGVPPGGALDEHAAQWANVLVGEPLNQPVLEILLHGARFRALAQIEVALTGAAATGHGLRWQTQVLECDDVLAIPRPTVGVWSYLAVRGGFVAQRWFGSVSIFPRGGLGSPLTRGSRIDGPVPTPARSPRGIGSRWVDPRELRDFAAPPPLTIWPGPQADLFEIATRDALLTTEWQISARSDRTGYRLQGSPLAAAARTIPSEPVIPGSIQIPPDGQPIITMRDGPTVGGYPKIALVDPGDLARLAQCRPGQRVRFQPSARFSHCGD